MRNIYLFLLFFFAKIASFAQNIVPNYSFEQSDSCPKSLNVQLKYGTGYNIGCKYWAQATRATPDYYNACATFKNLCAPVSDAGVPANCLGNQLAYYGDAYCGGYTYDYGGDYKEYIMVKIPPLIVDTPYEVSMYVSLAEETVYAVGGFGVLFTTYGSPDTATKNTIVRIPQVDYASYGIISDSTNWVRLSKTFIPDSAYSTMIIGVFKTSDEIDTLNIGNLPGWHFGRSYYYYDNISVSKKSTVQVSATDLLPEISIYPNPAKEALHIENVTPNTAYTLYDLVGEVVQEGILPKTNNTIALRSLPAGMYLLHLTDEEGRREVRKVVKE